MAEDPDLNLECTLKCENHFSVLISKLHNLLAHKKFVDVSLVFEDQLVTAHCIILIAFSPYFEEHFSNQPDDGTLHEVTLQGVRADSVKALIQYMYTGEVTVPRDQLSLLLKTASFFKMEGFYMEAQEEDVSISQMSTLISKPNNNWATNETVIKKETDEDDTVEAVESSNENCSFVANPQRIGAIKKELMDFEEQSLETTDAEELNRFVFMLCDSVGIESHLNHLPIPISFKGLYSNDDESAGVDDGEKKEEILENIDQIIEQSAEYYGRSEISGHSSLNDDDDVNSFIESPDEDTSPGSMVWNPQILENQQDACQDSKGLPHKKNRYSKALKTVADRPFKCTNNCGSSYKRNNHLNRDVSPIC